MEYDFKDISICIPAFNEEVAIESTLNQLRSAPDLSGAEIIVVDDGSIDKTYVKAISVDGVKVIRHRRNLGYGASIKTAIKASNKKYVAWYDADGQHRPSDLIKLVKRIKRSNSDWGIGIRSHNSHQQSNRKLGKFLLNIAVQIAARRPVPDFNSGMRIFRRECIIKYMHLLPEGFSASTTSTLLMTERGYISSNIKIEVQKRIGKSQVKQFRDGMTTLLLILRIFLLFRAFLFFFTIGSFMLTAGAIYTLVILWLNNQGMPVGGLFLMMTGVITILMGLIADQLSLIRRERFEDVCFLKNDDIKGG